MFCTVTIKWNFGEISLTMNKEQALDWRPKILEAFEGISVHLNRKNIGIQTEVPSTNQICNQSLQNNLSLKQGLKILIKNYYDLTLANLICNKIQAPIPPPLPLTLPNKKVQSANLLNKKHQSQPTISYKPFSVNNRVGMIKTSKAFNAFKPIEQKKLFTNNKVEVSNKIKENDFSTKIEDLSIDYSSTSSLISNHKTVSWPDQKIQKNANRNGLRRSWSSSVLDLKYY